MGYEEKLVALQKQGRFRSFSAHERLGGPFIEQDGKRYINLSSNDYLGIAGNEELQRTFYRDLNEEGFLDRYGLGSASSRLLSGDYTCAHRLEHRLARSYKKESALLYNSGYHANIGVLPALAGKGDLVLSDKLNHASIHDGLRLCHADHKRFRHCDLDQLRTILESHRQKYKRVFIVSESVFSMDGDVADIVGLVTLKKEFDCFLYLDEAHGVGLYGENGLGKAEEFGLLPEIDILVGTFGKAYASVGAYLVCSSLIKDFLINHSRSLIFTTALPAISYAWNEFVFKYSLGLTKERAHLREISSRLRTGLQDVGLQTAGESNIVPVIIGEDNKTVALATRMRELGVYILPVRPPTVPQGTARFRLSLCANMDWPQLENLPQKIMEQM